jgi:hypothetical protein
MANIQWDDFDKQAECEASAISQANKLRPRNARLRGKYYQDGVPCLTGAKHRNGGYYMQDGHTPTGKRPQMRATKQRNLRRERLHAKYSGVLN